VGDAVEHAAVHDGAIDRPYIAKLKGEARLGTKQANFNAAMGHHAAASFEISHGDMEHALADERTALIYAPEEPALLMDVAYVGNRADDLLLFANDNQAAPNNAAPDTNGWTRPVRI